MELFNFYLDKRPTLPVRAEAEILVPIVRNTVGYGILYWPADNSGKIVGERHGYFENNEKSVTNFDRNYNRFGTAPLVKANKSEYQRLLILGIFDKGEMAIRMWF